MRNIKLITLFVLGSALLLPFLTSAATIEEMQSQIAALLRQVSALQDQISQQRGNATTSAGVIMPGVPDTSNVWCYDFKKSLKAGAQGSDVAALQTALEKEGATITDSEKQQGVYGASTIEAVVKFQEKNKNTIKGFSDPTARGIFGPQTRGVMGSIRGCKQESGNHTCLISTQVIPRCEVNEKLVTGLRDSFGCALPPRCVSPTPESAICGGIEGKTCSGGLTCKLDGDYPDALGKCIIAPTPKVPSATSTLPMYGCPMYRVQPSPDFCKGGRITYPKNQYGCANTPVCEYAGIATTTPLIYPINQCAQYKAPSPDFCIGGRIIIGVKNEYGCQLPPRCEREAATTTSISY